MMHDVTNHLVPWTTVKKLLKGAWQEGHETPWEREPDNCKCYAWNSGECGCGEYGNGRIITPKPYDKENK